MKLGVIVSGAGTNLQAIMDAIENGELPAEIAVVVSNCEHAFALERARKYGYKALFLNQLDYEDRETYDRALAAALHLNDVDMVVLAGFMRLLTPYFIKQFEGRIVNIHPSLLPSFPGLNAVGKALDHGVKITGCTVHFVDEGLDNGPIIAQKAVSVEKNDTVDILHDRIHRAEHKLYPRVLALLCENKVKIKGRRCIIND